MLGTLSHTSMSLKYSVTLRRQLKHLLLFFISSINIFLRNGPHNACKIKRAQQSEVISHVGSKSHTSK